MFYYMVSKIYRYQKGTIWDNLIMRY